MATLKMPSITCHSPLVAICRLHCHHSSVANDKSYPVTNINNLNPNGTNMIIKLHSFYKALIHTAAANDIKSN